MKVLERNGQIFGRNRVQAVGRCDLEDYARPDQASGIVQHMTERFFEMRIKRGRQRKTGTKCICEWLRLRNFHWFFHQRSDFRIASIHETFHRVGISVCSFGNV